jgi:hypothetical protein
MCNAQCAGRHEKCLLHENRVQYAVERTVESDTDSDPDTDVDKLQTNRGLFSEDAAANPMLWWGS